MSSLSEFKFFQSLSRLFQLTSLSTLLEFICWSPTSYLRMRSDGKCIVACLAYYGWIHLPHTRIAVSFASEEGHGVRRIGVPNLTLSLLAVAVVGS